MLYDVMIIGGGPAGLTAAVYARRASKSVLVLEKETFGGQITFSPKVENIPGFTELSGNEFAEKLVDQALYQGAELESCEVLSVSRGEDGAFTLKTDGGDYTGRSVILASGAKHRTLGIPGEEAFIGNGISFCAVCDGAFYEGRDVIVVGGGNSALQEALLLSELVRKLVIVQDLDFLTGEEKMQNQLRACKNVEIFTGCTVEAYLGKEELRGLRVRSKADGTVREIPADGVFLAVGLIPQNEPFADWVKLDGRGYADAGENCVSSTPGIFVAGDCRAKRIRQVATAAADGAVAALAACDYLDRAN